METSEIIDSLVEQIDKISQLDDDALDAAKRKAVMIARRLFGQDIRYITDIDNITFYPMLYPTTNLAKRESWESGIAELKNIAITMREEIELNEMLVGPKVKTKAEIDYGKDIFIVHGHDQEMKEAVARAISKIGLNPIILHEKPNQGRTIIEKFTDYADVGFAIIVLSPDDLAYEINESPENALFRARQNVIFELGYFIGRLGRERVVSIFRQKKGFDIPSDYSGVIFVPYDDNDKWQFDLVKELSVAGYDVDANKLLE